MKKTPIMQKFSIVFLFVILTSCTLPIPTQPGSQSLGPDYTAAAQTIAAQLTEFVDPGSAITPIQSSPGANLSPAAATPTETLPNTSTPLPTKTPLPSNTPTITLTGTATSIPTNTVIPTVTMDQPESSLGEPHFLDEFNDGTNWFVYSDEHVTMELQDGTLIMSALNADKYEAMMLSNQPILTDFYMAATIQTTNCSGLDRYGLIVRAPGFDPIQGYLFGFTCDGRYSLRVFDGVSFTALIQWTSSELIAAGSDQKNVLGFYALGKTIKLYANSGLLVEYQDERFSSGYFGLFIGAYSDPGAIIRIDQLAYWTLP